MPGIAAAVLVGSLGAAALGGCGGASPGAGASPTAAPTATAVYDPATSGPDTPAARLRVRWNLLLEEHQVLAFKTTGAVLAGHTDEARAYEDQLGRNGTDLGDLIAATYTGPARDRFNPIWIAHDRALVQAAHARVTEDAAAGGRALIQQTGKFVPELATLLAELTGLPRSGLARAAAQQASDSATIADAQAARNYAAAYTTLHSARDHLSRLADALATATSLRHRQAFPGDATSSAASLAVQLNSLLQEHAYEVTSVTSALMGGRADEQAAATRALRTNTADLARVLDVFGSDAQRRFTRIWSVQDADLIDYAHAGAAGDAPGAQLALQNLTQHFTPQLITFLTTLLDTPPDPLTPLIHALITSTTAVVDAQVAQRVANAAQADRLAAGDITQIAGRLAAAITTKVPERFT